MRTRTEKCLKEEGIFDVVERRRRAKPMTIYLLTKHRRNFSDEEDSFVLERAILEVKELVSSVVE